eukprot:5606219-Prorocentrum_lima.AAC.1
MWKLEETALGNSATVVKGEGMNGVASEKKNRVDSDTQKVPLCRFFQKTLLHHHHRRPHRHHHPQIHQRVALERKKDVSI